MRRSKLVAAVLVGCGLAALGCKPARVRWAVPEALAETRRPTASGEVLGGEGRYGSQAWLGIPFAAPPIGPLRWKAPQPAPAWAGQRSALAFGPACAQVATTLGGSDGATPGAPTGSEDCLTLNLWAPKVSLDALASGGLHLPVMVWIHGGGNSIGTAAFFDGGHLAAEQNVLVVTVQYRLGPFGWLRHPALREGATPAEQSGNFGTLDLIAALKWVQANIQGFGGDPGNVTIFGESAGGQNVYSLLVAPEAKGLFHRAIAQSGGLSRTTVADAEGFTDDAVPGHQSSSNEALLRLLVHQGQPDRAKAREKLRTLSDAEVQALLRKASTEEVLALYSEHQRAGMLDMPLVIRDGVVLPKDDWQAQLARPDGWNRVPVMTGTNRDEVKLFFVLDPRRVKRVLGVLPRYLDEPRYHAEADAMSRLWKATAVDGPAAAMRASGAKDIFVYRFDWADEPTRGGADLSKMVGAAHGLEIPFVFGHFDLGALGEFVFTADNQAGREQLSEQMRAYWAEFARTGNPGKGLHGTGVEWKAWAETPGADTQLVFDTAAKGGVRMTADRESITSIVASVDEDPRLPSQKARCRLFHDLAGGTHGLTKEAYATAGVKGCAAFPYDRYPWEEP